MNDRLHLDPLWGKYSPLTALTGAALIILSSSRFSFAVTALGALLWVYGLTIGTLKLMENLLPRIGKNSIAILLSSLYSYGYYYLFSLFSPLMALEAAFPLALVPITFIARGLYRQMDDLSLSQALGTSLYEALILGLLLMGLALFREPFGFGVLTIPSPKGIFEFFGSDIASHYSIRLVVSTAGGLLILGYLVALFRVVRNFYSNYLAQRENK